YGRTSRGLVCHPPDTSIRGKVRPTDPPKRGSGVQYRNCTGVPLWLTTQAEDLIPCGISFLPLGRRESELLSSGSGSSCASCPNGWGGCLQRGLASVTSSSCPGCRSSLGLLTARFPPPLSNLRSLSCQPRRRTP